MKSCLTHLLHGHMLSESLPLIQTAPQYNLINGLIYIPSSITLFKLLQRTKIPIASQITRLNSHTTTDTMDEWEKLERMAQAVGAADAPEPRKFPTEVQITRWRTVLSILAVKHSLLFELSAAIAIGIASPRRTGSSFAGKGKLRAMTTRPTTMSRIFSRSMRQLDTNL
jgi:hypothetical protein